MRQKNSKDYLIAILKWSCIGLAIRLLLMPFTMHGQDQLFINYFPMMLIREGAWDPYGLIRSNYQYFLYNYYGPMVFIITTLVDFVYIKIFNIASYIKMLEISGPMIFKHFTTVDYVHAFSEIARIDLFKNIFLTKAHFLIFDFSIAFILLKLAREKKNALYSYKLWMLNIVVLHSAYAIGGLDLIPAFFIIAALLSSIKKRPYLSIICLSLGGATKLFPYLLILPSALLLGENWKKKGALLLTAIVVTIPLYLPFYLSSKNAVFDSIMLASAKQYSGMTKWVLMGIFCLLYCAIIINSLNESRKPEPEKRMLFYFLTIGFLSYAIIPISLRYFIFIMPLLVLLIPQYRRFGIFTLFLILILAFLRLSERYVQMGLFVPLNPEYFISFPTFQELVARFINIEIVYKVMARVLMLSFFVSAYWVWRIKETHNKSITI